jgi:serine/threonine protein kinase
MDEARVVAQLEHPSIVPIHDFGRLGDGRLFYTMKYVEGSTLAAFRVGTEDRPELLRVFQKVVDAVAFAHSRGVLHRDIKPSNVMVGAFGEVLVMDWGIASRVGSVAIEVSAEAKTEVRPVAGDEGSAAEDAVPATDDAGPADPGADTRRTADGTVLGTPGYMAPEQARGEIARIDWRSDVYGLGALLYFVLTGRHAFAAAFPEAIRQHVIEGRFPRPRSVLPKIPRRLEAICLKAMALDPRDRYQSSEAMGEDIALYLDDRPISAYRENPIELAGRWVSRHRFIVLIILTYILVRILIFFFLRT